MKKALSIVVLPGQATGKVQDVLDILQTVEANNRLVPIWTLADCQDTVSKWWSAVLLASAYSMLDHEQDKEQQELHKIIECIPYRAIHSSKSIDNISFENKLGHVVKATMESYRMIGFSSYTLEERLNVCDVATSSLEEITESLIQRQEEQCQADSKDEQSSDKFSVLKVMFPKKVSNLVSI